MLKSFLKIGLRNLIKQKYYSLISISGLAIGIAASAMIFLWVNYELSYDRFFTNYKNIYRITTESNMGGQEFNACLTPSSFAQAFSESCPEVKYITRTTKYFDVVLEANMKSFKEKKAIEADTNFFRVFNFKFIEGSEENPFPTKNSIVLTRTLAKKYFGDERATGKILSKNGKEPLMVSAVIEDVPPNSHMHFDCVLYFNKGNYWNNFNWLTYVLFKNNFSKKNVTYTLQNIVDDHIIISMANTFGVTTDQFTAAGNKIKLEIQPLKSIHLKSNFIGEFEANGSMTYVVFFITIGFFILSVAFINYINLSSVYYDNRLTEIGIRKATGATRDKLIYQFLVESFVISITAFILGILIMEVLLPVFKLFLGLNFNTGFSQNLLFKLIIFGAVVLMGMISGIYPATRISGYKIISIISSKQYSPIKSSFNARSILVVFQYATTIVVIIATILIIKQINFLNNKDLGFKKEQLVVIEGANYLEDKKEIFKNELEEDSRIVSLCYTDTYPGNGYSNINTYKVDELSPDKPYVLKTIGASPDYFKTFDMKIIEGHDFQTGDHPEAILNEKAAEIMNLKNPLSDKISIGNNNVFPIVGIVKNFNHDPLNASLDPILILLNDSRSLNFVIIRIAEGDIRDAMDLITNEWNKLSGKMPLEYYFLDSKLQSAYNAEMKAGKVFSIFTVLSIIIACLGMLGMVSFILQKRVKEIGIRKVNGAKVSEVLIMLNRDLVKWVVIAFIIATPIAYYAMHKWLENFAYKTNLSWWIFALAGVLALGIALLTVSWQSWRAATRNPVEALRYE